MHIDEEDDKDTPRATDNEEASRVMYPEINLNNLYESKDAHQQR